MLVRFSLKLNFLDRYAKTSQIPNFMKIPPVGGESFHSDRQTDRHDEANTVKPA